MEENYGYADFYRVARLRAEIADLRAHMAEVPELAPELRPQISRKLHKLRAAKARIGE